MPLSQTLQTSLDAVLANTVAAAGGAPGVVAMLTDREGVLYEGAAGHRQLGQPQPMTPDTVMAIFSTTKALTGTLAMMLVEQGRVSLDDPVRRYVPEIVEIQVLDGFAADGTPRLRAPRRDMTLRHLLLHTAGFSYEFFSADDLRFREHHGIPSVVSSTFDSVRTVLLADPGERWGYGVNIDWLGKVIEAVHGRRLGEVMHAQLLAPLGMHDTAFTMTPSMQARRACIHQRDAEGRLVPVPELVLPQPPAMDMGGHGLYATVGDYLKFLRLILNDGVADSGERLLAAATVAQMATNGLGPLKVGGWQTSIPSLSNSGEFFPGLSRSWGLTFMVNDEPAPTGRPAGSLMWAGLANLYYWIDRQHGIAGYWATQVLPFQDIGSYPGFVDFETAVYRHRADRG